MKFFFVLIWLQIIFFGLDNTAAQSVDVELLKKADNFYYQKKYYKAKKIYESLLDTQDLKNKADLLFKLGNSYYYLRQREKAYNIFKQILSDYPDFKSIKNVLFKAVEFLQYKHKYPDALNLLEKYFTKLKDKDIGKKIIELYKYSKDYSKGLSFLENNFSMSKWFVEQKTLLLKGLHKYNDAVIFLKKNIKKYDDLKFYQLLADLYAENRDLKNSALWYEKAYFKSKNIEYLLNEGRMFAYNNKISDAKRVWNKIFKLYNYNRYSYEIVARVYKEFALYDDLIKLYDRAETSGFNFFNDKINILEILGKINDVLDEFIKKINIKNYYSIKDKILQIAFVNEEFDKVEKYLTNTYIKKEFVYPILIEIYIKKRDSKKIQRYFKNYINNAKINYVFIIDLINKMNNQSLYNEESDVLYFLEKKKLLNDPLRLKYMEILYIIGEYSKTIEIGKSIKNKIFSKEAAYYKGVSLIEMKKYSRAKKYFVKYKNEFPFYTKLIDIMIFNKKYSDAYSLIKQGENKKNFNKPELLYKEGFVSAFLNHTNSVSKIFKKIIKIYPDSKFANDSGFYLFLFNKYSKYNSLILEYLKSLYLKNFNLSHKILDKLLLAKKDDIINFLKAQIYFKQHKYSSAIKELNKIDTKYILPYALEFKANIYEKYLRNENKAISIYKEILKSYPGYVNIQDIRNKLFQSSSDY